MLRLRFCRPFSSSSSPKGSRIYNFLSNSRDTPAQPASPSKPSSLLRFNAVTSPNTPSSFPRYSLLALSTSVAAIASYTILSDNNHTRGPLEESVSRLFHHMRQTGVAASVLWQSLSSVLSSANHEVRSGFELRVASLLADIAAVSPPRRVALVGAGGGKVLDWLLETVAVGGERCGVQAEAARALAYLIADPNVSSDVLGRPHAVTYLLRFVFSCQPKKKKRRSSFDLSDSLKGRSMLVAAIMDIVTSNCNRVDKYYKPLLPGNADLRDILAAIEVIEEGGLHMDKLQENEDEDDDDGGDDGKGIGIKILEGTTALSFTRNNEFKNLENSNADCVETGGRTPKTVALLNKHDSSPAQDNLSSVVVPGLWDDLHCQHVAVPFAAWALANWAMSSTSNRSRIWELDQDGNAVKTALMAPERSVKWHGSLMARLLLEDQNLLLNNSISDWSSTLLTTIYHASKNDDIPLAEVALSAFLISIERCPGARKMVMEKGLHVMRDTAKLAAKHKKVQEALAKALELIYAKEKHFSLEESQKWSGILLPWLFRKTSSDSTRASSSRILSCILEEHGPAAVPISQGWLAMMLNEVVVSQKASSVRGLQPKSDKVKTQIDQSNILLASQTTNQLAAAVVNLAGNQLGLKFDSIDSSPLADLLSLEPFAGPTKNLKGENVPKLNVADSALATLKGIKVLTELCSGDLPCQEKMAELGVLCLLRRFLLCDDYEKLAAMEAYDAFRAPEAPENVSNNTGELSKNDTNNQSSIQVPSASHIRRHAARLLTILSALPKVQKVILADKTWCKWLEDCANGDILGCTDPKLQSYARATLLNVVCNCPSVKASKGNDPTALVNKSGACPRYDDMLFLINPEMPHWKLCDYLDGKKTLKDASDDADRVNDRGSAMTRVSNLWNDSTAPNESSGTDAEVPQVDVVFIHGLRGGPYKTWRISENKVSTKSGLVEKIDEEAGKSGTFWPGEWLSTDFPQARMFTIKYKTNLTQWSGASLPLQEVSSQLLEKLLAAGIGNRPVVFVTHSMGGLVVKQILHKAKAEKLDKFINNTVGVVFYSCPHFGSKLADMPWRIGFVLRPAPSVGELRSGSQRLVELNDFLRNLHKKGLIDVLSFCETKVTPIVEGYGGWAFRMEIVPLESAYPGFGELVVLESTDHVNSCKPLSRTDPSYTETLEFLRKLYSHYSERGSSQ